MTEARCEDYLSCCLYFTANSLSRTISRMAEEAFMQTGLSPSLAFVVMLVNEFPGLSQKELAERMNLAPSTVTRFVDKLAAKKLVLRQTDGKAVLLKKTEAGADLEERLRAAWKQLYEDYCRVLGKKNADKLTADINNANRVLGA